MSNASRPLAWIPSEHDLKGVKTMVHTEKPEIPGYELLAVIGQGAQATVWKARQLGTDREVALKIMPLLSQDDGRAAREAIALARADHPNVAQVYDFDQTATHAYLVQKLIVGRTLSSAMKARLYTPAEAIGVMRAVLPGLHHVHMAGIDAVRDFKPDNVMLWGISRTNAVLIDLGVARLRDSTLTVMHDGLFTPAFASPEQYRGEVVDCRTDIWSAGVTLYLMLTGQKPFAGDLAAIRRAVEKEEPIPLAVLRPDLPPRLDAVLRAALAKDRTRRYDTALDFLGAIETAAAGLVGHAGATANRSGAVDPSTPWCRPGAVDSSAPWAWRRPAPKLSAQLRVRQGHGSSLLTRLGLR